MTWEIVWQERPGIPVCRLVEFREVAMGERLVAEVRRCIPEGRVWFRRRSDSSGGAK